MEYITDYKNDDKTYEIYYDKEDNVYYKVYGDEAFILSEDELKCAVIASNIKAKNEENQRKVIRARELKKEERKNKIIRVLIIAGLSIGLVGTQFVDDIKFAIEEESTQNNLDFLKANINGNKTIDKDEKQELFEYVRLISELDVKDMRMITIANNLKWNNYRGAKAVDIINDALGLNDNGFVARELYYKVNGVSGNKFHTAVSNALALENNVITKIVNGKSIEDIIYDIHGIKINLKKESRTDLERLENIANGNSCELGFCNGEFYKLENNLFDDYIRVTSDLHDIYFESDYIGLREVTDRVYYEKLGELIDIEGDEIDYTNMDDRMLVYLYANAVYTGAEYSDITSYLINGTDVYSSLGINIVEKSELYTYLSNPEKYDRTYLALFSELAFFGEKSLPLLQEINLCLKEEVREGYLTQDMYEYFINSALEIYLDESQELYDKFLDAIINNKSVDGFKLSLSRYDIA